MTTIACDGETMAADGLTASGGTVFGHNAVKVHQLKDGRIVGIAGCAYYGPLFREWLESDGELPELGEDFEALVLHPDGTCLSYDHKGRTLEEELPTATGSGREFALAAMDLGASPEEAVEIASKRDTTTGGKITVLTRPRKLRRVA
jgi:ATP-dependent protease HslVU (ClpYQ) peptidase subunit